jgi:transcriptional regulator with GAF, ATPase, and Fis domain
VAVVLPVAAVVIWLQHLPFGTSAALLIGCLLMAAIPILVLCARFRTPLKHEVESSLLPTRREAREAIQQLCTDLARLPVGDGLHQRFTTTVMDGLGLSGVALYCHTAKPGCLKRSCSLGNINAPLLVNGHALRNQCAADQAVIIVPPSSANGHEVVVSLPETLGWAAYLPARTNGTWLGLIALGPKRSGAAIDDADVTLLTMVASQFASALQQAALVQQIEDQKAEIEELQKKVAAENHVVRAEVRAVAPFKEIIGSSQALQEVLGIAEKVAPTKTSVLITGETGTGKELIARAVHDLSPRRAGPLISVNCPAIPPNLAEAELFGHERGAFTDAVEARAGKFELAHGGTIFLDEVADLTPELQVKLLRVLETHEVQRIGSHKVRKLDLRVVAATNRDLQSAMRSGLFREDLYYRLAAVSIHVPPLRARPEDVPMLASFFLERAASTYQKAIKGFAPDAIGALGSYSWPGNVRELQHVVERAVLLCDAETIRPEHLSDLASPQTVQSLEKTLREQKVQRVQKALAQTGGNQAAAARLLGMSRSNFGRMLKSLGLKRPLPATIRSWAPG